MAIVCRDYAAMDTCASALRRRGLPLQLRKRAGDFNPGADAITVMTVRVSKGLEFPVVAMPGVGHMPAPDQEEQEEARLFYVGATRATQRLIVGVSGDGAFGRRLHPGAI
jgi:superfamily I DNA/RNA helicase